MINLRLSPLAELLKVISDANPTMSETDLANMTVKSCKTITGQYNTQIELTPAIGSYLSGTIRFKYNRRDPAELFNKFGLVSKYPKVRVFGLGGTTKYVENLISYINEALGTNLTCLPPYQDLNNISVSLPAKNASNVWTIGVCSNTGTGFPKSLRFTYGTALKVTLFNVGQRLNDIALTRMIKPFITDTNELKGLPIPADGSISYPNIQTHAADATSIFGPYNAPSEFSQYVTAVGTDYRLELSESVTSALNWLLAENEAKCRITLPKFQWLSPYSAPNTAWNTICKSTGSLASDPRVNTAFTHVIVIAKDALTFDADAYPSDMYIHYNRLYV